MFGMTNDITIGGFKPFKCSACTWKRSKSNYCDSATIIVPAISMLKSKDSNTYSRVQTGSQFKIGMPVTISCGYDGKNKIRFKGFIKKISLQSPLLIECEGYSYQLQLKRSSHNYTNISLRKILEDVVTGTDIKLSNSIPDVPVKETEFKNCTGIEILEYIKTKMLQTVYFEFDTLYVGLRYTEGFGKVVNHRLNWNTVDDKGLVFDVRPPAQVNYVLQQRKQTGEKHHVRTLQAGDEKIVKMFGIDATSEHAKKIRDDLQKYNDNKAFSGKLVGFLEPMVTLNDISSISDSKYQDKAGRYVIEAIEGSFNNSGGRQNMEIGIKV
jgi:hypothetical protein